MIGKPEEGRNICCWNFLNILPLTVCFLTDCSITLIDKTDGSGPMRRKEYWRKFLKTVAPYIKYFKLMVTSARLYTFLRGRSQVYVKCILLNHTCVFCKEFDFCSIILFIGDSNRVETNQSICITS